MIKDQRTYRNLINRIKKQDKETMFIFMQLIDYINRLDAEIEKLKNVQIDLSEYSDKLWKNAYERGRKEEKDG